MQQRKKSQGDSKVGGSRKSRSTKLKAEVPVKLEPAPKSEEEDAANVVAPVAELEQVADAVPAADTAFPADKPDYIRMYCNRCGKRLTLKSQNPGTPGSGPYQGYCRPCAVEYVVQVSPIG